MLVCSLHFKLPGKVKNILNSDQHQNQGLFHARSSIRDDDSGICWIKWRTNARDSPNLTLERARNNSLFCVNYYQRHFNFKLFLLPKNTRSKLTPIKIYFELLLLSNVVLLICGSVFTYIDKLFFPHFGQFSERLYDFKHSYLSQKLKSYIKIEVSSLAAKNISFLKNPVLLCISRLMKQEYLFLVTR